MSENYSNPPTEQGQPSGQLRRFEADLKEVIPIDLYDGSYRASLLQTDLIEKDPYTKAKRHAREFYQMFHLLFRTLKRYLPKNMEEEISEWISHPKLDNTSSQEKGIELFYKMYDEMCLQGIGELFETPITPPIGNILGDNLNLDIGPSSLPLTEEIGEEYINPGDIGNLIGGYKDV
jgi:hypothetical protein